jgi:hypothetical protein
MASVKQQVRLLLDPATADQLHHASLRESRALAAMCMVLIKEALSARRAAAAQVTEVSRLAAILKSPSDVAAE